MTSIGAWQVSDADNQARSEAGGQADARWMTFKELASLRGISKLSAATLVRRHGWRRQRDNQGHVIALVPLTWANSELDGQADDLPDREADNPPDSRGYIAAFEAALSALREAKDGEIAAWRERTEAAEARAERAEQATAGHQVRADGLRDMLEAMRDQLTTAEAEVKVAHDRAWASGEQQAEAERRAAADRERADRVEARAAHEREDFLDAEARTRRELETVRERLEAAEQDGRQARVEAQEAAQVAEAVRQADAERKARGRWARLRAAWRGR